jgi:hypothetical protein
LVTGKSIVLTLWENSETVQLADSAPVGVGMTRRKKTKSEMSTGVR